MVDIDERKMIQALTSHGIPCEAKIIGACVRRNKGIHKSISVIDAAGTLEETWRNCDA